MSKSAKVAAYVAAALQNPQFIVAAAKRYGELQSAGESGLVPVISMAQLATAVAELEKQLMDSVKDEPRAN
jgi:hypothetical protein